MAHLLSLPVVSDQIFPVPALLRPGARHIKECRLAILALLAGRNAGL
jgi:hypothetical protein